MKLETSNKFKKLLFILFLISVKCSDASALQPNIIFILADDLGFNDVSFHGSSQIFTPNLDALAFSGIILNRYYVTPICTPSRSALMTGKYPIHTGMQHAVLYGAEPRGLPLHEKLLPEYLRALGYSNHIVGKWHLGSYKRVYTPLMRGFDSHVGPWTGHHDYFDHYAMEKGMTGLDMRRGFDVAYDLHGRYTTDVITDEAVNIINNRNTSQPLFLYVAHTAVHSSNPYSPLPAPDATVAGINNIEDYNRRKFAAMLQHLDFSVGEIVEALAQAKILSNSIIVFSTDNGGPAAGFNLNAASNFPLRGVKNTLWEGGLRGAGFIWSPHLNSREIISEQMIHISDWLPTLYHAAGGDASILRDIDGINMWDVLSENLQSPRSEILHNIDNIWGSSAITIDKWKLVVGTNYNGQWDGWYGPEGDRNVSSYFINDLLTCKTARALKSIQMLPTTHKVLKLRNEATVTCSQKDVNTCNPLTKPCLFDILNDPCESSNLADKFPNIVKTLTERLLDFNASSIAPGNLPIDERGNPIFFDHTWTNFGDFI
ncbi:CLUMA_CG013896, isoform A [Clunio marinus]|uniref:CLUMA_CG013896, isoform A n=1 Tax=Clunio marinus TaxID=568069 RepID=A0A1J1IM47_9DIPT|nr:CLUMA_CG013896, isoform A [Clunio marinus]